MIFTPLAVAGAYLVGMEPQTDERGFFARVFCAEEFAARGLNSAFVQESAAYNRRAATVRGFHYQKAPHEEVKLVHCVRGSIYDVILDIRPDSSTYGQWCAVTLRAGEWQGVYIPAGCAHAYQALEDDTELLYRMSAPYAPAASAGFRYDSPSCAVAWPLPNPILSERDRSLPAFEPHASV